MIKAVKKFSGDLEEYDIIQDKNNIYYINGRGKEVILNDFFLLDFKDKACLITDFQCYYNFKGDYEDYEIHYDKKNKSLFVAKEGDAHLVNNKSRLEFKNSIFFVHNGDLVYHDVVNKKMTLVRNFEEEMDLEMDLSGDNSDNSDHMDIE